MVDPPPGRLDRLLTGFARATERIRSPRFWRLLYAVIGSRAAVALAGLALRAVRRRAGPSTELALRERIFHALARSGWPHHDVGWRNLHVSRLLWHAHLQSHGRRSGRRRPSSPAEPPLRTGVLAMLSKAFSFPLELFQAAPSELELVFFDIPWIEGRGADYLADVGAGYGRYPLREASWEADVRRLAGAIDEADLDLLLVIGDKREFYDTLDHVRRPGCIAYVAQGIDLLYHPNVDFHLHAEREADYFVDGDRMFCGTTRAPFGDDLVFAGRIYYDPRGITPESRRPSRDRDSLMIFHGSLYKALSRPYLETIFGLMQDDADLRFVLMGKDWDGRRAGGAFEAIRELAKQRGVDRRVHYDGAFVAERGGERGEILDPGWQRLRDHLDRARLAPNPWPIGGASSRVEAYLAGVPVPHLAVRTDPESWGRPQHGGGEIPALLVESTTTWSPQEYVEVARRALYDDEFAQQVVLDQLAVAHAVTDPAAYWGQLLGFYRSWAESVEA